MKTGDQLDNMTSLLKDFHQRINRLERRRPTSNGGGSGGGGVDEVWIGTSPPVDPNVELWFDPDATMLTAVVPTDETTGEEGP